MEGKGGGEGHHTASLLLAKASSLGRQQGGFLLATLLVLPLLGREEEDGWFHHWLRSEGSADCKATCLLPRSPSEGWLRKVGIMWLPFHQLSPQFSASGKEATQ